MKRMLFVVIVLGLACSGCTLLIGGDVAFIQKDSEVIRAFVPAAVFAIKELTVEDGGYGEDEKAKLLLYADEIIKNRDAWDTKLGTNVE